MTGKFNYLEMTMQKPEFITFTGIDDRTDLTRAAKLADKYPIEWGVLFSPKNQDSRYPCEQAVAEITSRLSRKSAHLCGGYSRDIQKGLKIPVPLAYFGRVQVNGSPVTTAYLSSLEAFSVEVILQARDTFPTVPDEEFYYLFDCSGGRGITPEEIPMLPGYLVGYAGGIGPDTVSEYLSRIDGEGPFWIDMEGQVRTNGWFDLDKVEKVCQIVYG